MIFINILLLIFILGILVLIHELGHFIFAKLFKVHIYEFAIGMGPVIKSIKGKDGVDYSIRAFPIGGYVSMAGEVQEDDEEIPKDKLMCNKPWYQRFIILVAGVTFNFILAIILLFIIAWIYGTSNMTPLISSVEEESPVSEAGLQVGDEIIEINGKKLSTIDEAQIRLILGYELDTYEFVVERDNEVVELTITPEERENEDGSTYKWFGLGFDTTRNHGFVNAVKYAGVKFVTIIDTMMITVGNLFTGNLSLNALSGPIGMYSVVEQSTEGSLSQAAANVIYLLAFISINLGFLNILPIPAFDGGRILFMIIEKIIGRKVNTNVENIIHLIFFILLMAFAVYIAFQDILKFF